MSFEPPPPPPPQLETQSLNYYRTFDPIENFKFKITLEKVADKQGILSAQYLPHTTAIAIPKDGGNDSSAVGATTSSVVQFKKFKRELYSANERESLEVYWQEKVFSPTEVERYKVLPSQPTMLDRKYFDKLHKEVLANNKSPELTVANSGKAIDAKWKLFTYVDMDGIDPFIGEEQQLTTAEKEKIPEAVKRMIEKRRMTKALRDRNVLAVTQHAESQDRLASTADNCGRMYVMAAFKVKTPTGGYKIVERRLCTLYVYDYGLIQISPKLSDTPNTFRFEIPELEETFDLTIQHLSERLTNMDAEKEWMLYQEFFLRQKKIRDTLIPTSFASLPDDIGFRLTMFGEILSAYEFPSDTLQVQYVLDLPDGWRRCSSSSNNAVKLIRGDDENDKENNNSKLNGANNGSKTKTKRKSVNTSSVSEGPLSGFTQTGSAAWNEKTGRYEVWFGLPIEMEVGSIRFDPTAPWPRIFIQVVEIDYWGRQTIHGYGWIDVPKTPGTHRLSIPTWTPQLSASHGDSVLASYQTRLKSYFIGATPGLEDLSYVANPIGPASKRLVKYGFKTISSGKVELRLNCVHQANAYSVHKKYDVADPARFVRNNFNTISAALERAKRRLEILRLEKGGGASPIRAKED